MSGQSRVLDFEGTHLSSTSPPYSIAPWTYENNQMLSVTIRTSPDLLQALVPSPLVANADGLMTIYVGALNVIHPEGINYREAGIMIPASYRGKAGSYMPVLYLDKVLPIIAGREVWGFPKFEAVVSLETRDGIAHACVVKEGVTLIDVSLRLGEAVPPSEFPPDQLLTMKSIPSVRPGAPPDVKQLVSTLIHNRKYTTIRPGEATLQLNSTSSDPLGTISVDEIISGVYLRGGFVLDCGEILHDYLAEENPIAVSSQDDV